MDSSSDINRNQVAETNGEPRPLSSLARTMRVCAIVAAIVLTLWALRSFVLDVFLVILLALLLRGLAVQLSHLIRLPVGIALTLVVVGLILIASIGLYYRGPAFATQIQFLYDHLSPEVAQLQTKYAGTIWERVIFKRFDGGPNAGMQIPTFSVLGTTFGFLATTIVILLAGVYVAVAPRLYVSGIVLLFPLQARTRTEAILHDAGRALQWWMVGQSVSMLAVGVISTIGLLILGVPLPFALGILAGLLTFIPYVGAWLGSIPALLMALTVGPYTTLWTAGVFLLCHLVEGYLLAPMVQRHTAHLPPALTLLSMVFVGSFYGTLGLILATPITAAVLVVVQEGYIASFLRDPAMRERERSRKDEQNA